MADLLNSMLRAESEYSATMAKCEEARQEISELEEQLESMGEANAALSTQLSNCQNSLANANAKASSSSTMLEVLQKQYAEQQCIVAMELQEKVIAEQALEALRSQFKEAARAFVMPNTTSAERVAIVVKGLQATLTEKEHNLVSLQQEIHFCSNEEAKLKGMEMANKQLAIQCQMLKQSVEKAKLQEASLQKDLTMMSHAHSQAPTAAYTKQPEKGPSSTANFNIKPKQGCAAAGMTRVNM